MGYSIVIGELEVEKHEDDGVDTSCISFTARGEHHKEAPAFGEPTDYGNSRWPSYGVWRNVLSDAGMEDLFFCDGHLIGGHPGIRLITKDLYKEFSKRKQKFERLHPGVRATYGNVENPLIDRDQDNPSCNSTYCRIVWLDYWMDWALKNCETPVIANS